MYGLVLTFDIDITTYPVVPVVRTDGHPDEDRAPRSVPMNSEALDVYKPMAGPYVYVQGSIERH